MSDVYDPAAIEPKWQEKWEAAGLYRAKVDWDKPKHLSLIHIWFRGTTLIDGTKVDLKGFEPLTSTMPLWRSPN